MKRRTQSQTTRRIETSSFYKEPYPSSVFSLFLFQGTPLFLKKRTNRDEDPSRGKRSNEVQREKEKVIYFRMVFLLLFLLVSNRKVSEEEPGLHVKWGTCLVANIEKETRDERDLTKLSMS